MSMEFLLNIIPSEFGLRVQLALVFVVTLLLGFIFQKRFRYIRYNLPPGPFSWPIVGHLPFLSLAPHLYYQELAKKYGNIFSLYLGDTFCVVLNDKDLIREALNKDSFNSKLPPILNLVPHANKNGAQWKEERQSLLRALRELGMGKTEGAALAATSQAVMVESFVEKLNKSEGQAVKVRDTLIHLTNNFIFKMITGSTIEEGSPGARDIEKYRSAVFSFLMLDFFARLFPLMTRFAILFVKKFKTSAQNARELVKIFDQEVTRHEMNPELCPDKDYINIYLREMKEKHPPVSHSRENLLVDSAFLMLAGTESTRQVVAWSFFCMAQYPDVQKKVYEEILNIVGHERLPEWSDSPLMPYTQAVFWEVARYVNILPFLEGRRPVEDESLGGYDIPRGTNIIMVFHSVHVDPKLWGDPERFRPERFLSQDGRLLEHLVDNVLLFAKGKRSCPGEGLARMSIFLYLSAVVQAFEILPPEGGLDSSVSYAVGCLLENATFVFKPRH